MSASLWATLLTVAKRHLFQYLAPGGVAGRAAALHVAQLQPAASRLVRESKPKSSAAIHSVWTTTRELFVSATLKYQNLVNFK